MLLLPQDLNIPSPLQPMEQDDIQLWIKREDLIDPDFGGNKWRKLKYNLEAFLEGQYKTLVTFGGPFSNHVAATASACSHYNIPCVAVIRGTYEDPNNPTLMKARAQGVQLIHVPKVAYKLKEKSEYLLDLLQPFDRPYFIPEGGSNALGFNGTAETMTEIKATAVNADFIIVSGGTGTTASGIISAATTERVIVMNALKNPELHETILSAVGPDKSNWSVCNDYHFGGFAKVTQQLISFINAFKSEHDLLLDPIYNAKAMWGLQDLIRNGAIPKGSKVVYVLTGGQQGAVAYNYRQKSALIKIN